MVSLRLHQSLATLQLQQIIYLCSENFCYMHERFKVGLGGIGYPFRYGCLVLAQFLSANHLLFKSRPARTTRILLSLAILKFCQIIVECTMFTLFTKHWDLFKRI